MQPNNLSQIAVLGAGSWGNSLAILLSQKGHLVTLWEFSVEAAEILQKTRKNLKYLGDDIVFPEALVITSELKPAVENADIIVLATPSHTIRSVVKNLVGIIKPNSILVNVAKGIENGTFFTMSQVIADVIPGITPDRIVALYGPSHAEEVSRGLPTTVVSASSDLETARKIREIFVTPMFRVYSNTDIIGVEIGGSIKNVMAIAAGISDGIGFGDNAKAALMTRGITEITRLGVALGAKKETFAGLTGIGDLIVTCMSRHSRNRHVGEEIGKGKTLKQVLDSMIMVAEGVNTTKSTLGLSQKMGIDMPITNAVHSILFEDQDPKEVVKMLMTRSVKDEDWGN